MKLNDCNLPQEAKLSIMRIALAQMDDDSGGRELLNELNALRLSDLEIFCRRMPMNIDIDPETFRSALDRLRHVRNTESMKHEFVRRGASNEVLHRLFGISKLQAEQIKAEEGLAGRFTGRPRLPAREIRAEVCEQWETLSPEIPDMRKRYLRLSDLFPELTIGALHQIVRRSRRGAKLARELEAALLD